MVIELDLWWVGFAMVAAVAMLILAPAVVQIWKKDGVWQALLFPILVLLACMLIAGVAAMAIGGMHLMCNNPPPWKTEIKPEQ